MFMVRVSSKTKARYSLKTKATTTTNVQKIILKLALQNKTVKWSFKCDINWSENRRSEKRLEVPKLTVALGIGNDCRRWFIESGGLENRKTDWIMEKALYVVSGWKICFPKMSGIEFGARNRFFYCITRLICFKCHYLLTTASVRDVSDWNCDSIYLQCKYRAEGEIEESSMSSFDKRESDAICFSGSFTTN